MSEPYLAHLGWKIIEVTSDGTPKFMFCGLQGSRSLPTNRWLHAEKRPVKDGRGTEYESGFHVIPRDIDMLRKYCKRFTNLEDKRVVQVVYQEAHAKPTKGSLALLADRILIWKEDIHNGIPLSDIVHNHSTV